MTEQELIAMVIGTITEFELSQYRKSDDAEYKVLNEEILQLSVDMQNVIKELSPESANIIESYISKSSSLAEKDCQYLYMQGAKNCVRSLKQLGVL